MPVLDQQERQALEEADARIAELQKTLEQAARSSALDGDATTRLRATADEAAARVNQELPVQIDPDAQNEIRRRLIELLTLPSYDQLAPLDRADRVLIEAEAVRHIIRDLLQEQPPVNMRHADQVIALIEDWLPGLTVTQVGDLLGISPRQVQRLRHDADAPSSSRMQLVGRLVAILRQAWTDEGVVAWFSRKRAELDGRSPGELLDDPANERLLLLAARSGRVQGGA